MPEESAEAGADGEPGTDARIQVAGFEERKTKTFAPQIEVSLQYEVGNDVRLFATFRLYSHVLIVSQVPPVRRDDEAFAEYPLPTTEVYQARCLLPICTQLPQAQKVLEGVIERRLRELAEASKA